MFRLIATRVVRSAASLACAACLVTAVPATGAPANRKHTDANSPWTIAEAARAQLAAIPSAERTAADYRTVMDAYRLIYHADPADLHAPESILHVGDLLAEEGAVLHDPRAMQASLGQYEFLRKQYPTSSLRIAALLEEAHIAAAGLHDARLAREKYSSFVEQYPHSAHAEEARAALASLRSGAMPAVTTGPLAALASSGRTEGTAGTAPLLKDGPPSTNVPRSAAPADTLTGSGGVAAPPNSIAIARRNTTGQAAASTGVAGAAVAPGERAEASLLASERKATPADTARQADQTAASREDHTASRDDHTASRDDTAAATGTAPLAGNTHTSAKPPAHTRSGLALVTGIRHWSTPTYTRVAIDLGDEVQYQAARVPHPDRIFFDLHGTRLAADLAGKSFNVVDDGFLKRVRIAQYTPDSTRVVLDVNDVTEYSAFLLPNPYRLIIDIHGGAKNPDGGTGNSAMESRPPDDPPTLPPSPAAKSTSTSAATPDLRNTGTTATPDVTQLSRQPGKVEATAAPTTQPIAVVADPAAVHAEAAGTTRRNKRNREAAADLAAKRTALPTTAAGDRSMMRALGLKIGRIVIDPGHGGHDSGTLGAGGIMEKDVVLDVALRLGKLLHDHLGAEIVYTRSDDTFIPLETRTAIANKAEADLFLSIHANSSQDESARGVETYYLNFTSQPDALDVAARENAVSDGSVHELATLVQKITLKDKIDESREFAQDVEQSLYAGLQRGNAGLKNRGVKKAPFVVLIGANMPSILTEISFVTNPEDAAQLRTNDYRERVAESIYRGVARYTQSLGGMHVASTPKADKPAE